nr:MAG TPA: YfiH [Caudoviricetes sp.]
MFCSVRIPPAHAGWRGMTATPDARGAARGWTVLSVTNKKIKAGA